MLEVEKLASATALRGRQLRGARRRDRRHVRAGRQRPHRGRQGDLRRPAGGRGGRCGWTAGRADFATPGRRRCGSGVAMLTEDRKGDGLALDAQRASTMPGWRAFRAIAPHGVIDGARRAAAGRRQDRRAVDPARAIPAAAGAPALRRQPAEGGARQVAAGRGHPSSSSSTSRRAASTSPPRSRSTG